MGFDLNKLGICYGENFSDDKKEQLSKCIWDKNICWPLFVNNFFAIIISLTDDMVNLKGVLNAGS